MKDLFRNLTIFFLLTAIFRCSKDYNLIDPSSDYFYSLKIGNKWEYTGEFYAFNFRPDTAGVTFPSDTILYNSVVEIVRTAILHGSIKTYVLLERLEENDRYFEGESYFNNREDGLYLYAYQGSVHAIPKPLALNEKRIYFKGRYFSHIREIARFIEKVIPFGYETSDSLYYEDPPLQSLKYPVQIGSQWVYRKVGNSWRIDKKILGKERIGVSAGEFNCYKIQWLYDVDNNGEWDDDIEFFDYICSDGLIRRDILMKDLIWGELDPDKSSGKFDVKEEFQLTNFHLE